MSGDNRRARRFYRTGPYIAGSVNGQQDQGVAAAAENQWVFETAWEVVNKGKIHLVNHFALSLLRLYYVFLVGGIFTVIRSKAQVSTDELGDQYTLIGPWNDGQCSREVEVMDPPEPAFARAIQQLKEHAGIRVVYGRWLIDGNPRVLLFDIGSASWKLDEWKQDFWNIGNIGVPWHDKESNDAIILGYSVTWFLEE